MSWLFFFFFLGGGGGGGPFTHPPPYKLGPQNVGEEGDEKFKFVHYQFMQHVLGEV